MAKRKYENEPVEPTENVTTTEDPSTAISNGETPATHVEAETPTSPSLGFDEGARDPVGLGQPPEQLSQSQTGEPAFAEGNPVGVVTDTGMVVPGPLAPGLPAPRDIVLYHLTAKEAADTRRDHQQGTQAVAPEEVAEGYEVALLVSTCDEEGGVTGSIRPFGLTTYDVKGASQGTGPGQWSFPANR